MIKIKYAVNIPNFGEYWDIKLIVDLAVTAEKSGWDGFFIWDHISGDPQYGDTWIALAAVALKTDRIQLGPMVTPIPRRRPWKVAREAVSIDHLSNGRLILGVGLGNPPTEYSIFGEETNPKIRAEKLDEGLDIIKGLWTGKPFKYTGKHFKLEETTFRPKPYQNPRIPIWVGGFWPTKKPYRRAAKYDGVYAVRDWPDKLSVSDLKEIKTYIVAHRKSKTKYDICVDGETPSNKKKAAKIIIPWKEAGATWWSESLNGWRGPLKKMVDRIKNGPPNI